jgi:hypothetical protein
MGVYPATEAKERLAAVMAAAAAAWWASNGPSGKAAAADQVLEHQVADVKHRPGA